MENRTLGIVATILGVLTLLGVGWVLLTMPATPVIPKCPDIPACNPVVVTETLTETVIEEIETDYKQKVVDALLEEAAKDKSFRKCDGTRYDIEEIAVKRVYDGFVVEEDNEGELSISDVRVKLNYDDGKCYRTFTCGLDSEQELSCN